MIESVLAAKTVLQQLELPDPHGFPTNGGIIAEIQLPDTMNYHRTESPQIRNSLKPEENPIAKSERREMPAVMELPALNSMKTERSQKAHTRHNPILAEIKLPTASQNMSNMPQEDFVIIPSPFEVAELGKKQGLPPLKKSAPVRVLTGLEEEGRLFTPLEDDE